VVYSQTQKISNCAGGKGSSRLQLSKAIERPSDAFNIP